MNSFQEPDSINQTCRRLERAVSDLINACNLVRIGETIPYKTVKENLDNLHTRWSFFRNPDDDRDEDQTHVSGNRLTKVVVLPGNWKGDDRQRGL